MVIGERGLKEGSVEVKWRSESAAKNLPLASAAESILDELAGARAKHDAYCRERIAAPRRSQAVMRSADPLPRLPYVLLAALSVVSLRRTVCDRRRHVGRPDSRAGLPTGRSSG